LYFDDTKLPFWPISDAGLRIAAHHYNMSIKRHGELRAVINGKILDENERKAMVWDIERGQATFNLLFGRRIPVSEAGTMIVAFIIEMAINQLNLSFML
jgi:hypothetical protein